MPDDRYCYIDRVNCLIAVCYFECNVCEVIIGILKLIRTETHILGTGIGYGCLRCTAEGEIGFRIKRIVAFHIIAGYGMFLTLLGHVPAYYAAMLLFTGGAIFITIMSGPYMTNRIPASHRGRVNSVMGVAGGIVSAVCELTVGHLYEGVSPAAAWTMVLCLLAAAVLGCLILMPLDRRAYPKLYGKVNTYDNKE